MDESLRYPLVESLEQVGMLGGGWQPQVKGTTQMPRAKVSQVLRCDQTEFLPVFKAA